MARMAIDDMVTRDPRVLHLAKLCGLPNRFEAIGRLLAVWSVCYDRVSARLSVIEIDLAAELDGFAKHMLETGLAVRENDQWLRISGVKQRIKYLEARSDAGRKGGVKSGESRRKNREANTKHSFKQSEAPLNPPVPDPVPDPDPPPVPDPEKNSATPSARGSSGSTSVKRKSKNGPTDAERASARRVLDKLGSRNGIGYTGTESHVALITTQLRSGVTELELRAVIAYCADKWADKPDMLEYLRPETLFGPKTIGRYLDPARSVYARELAEAKSSKQPQLTLVPESPGAAS